MDAPNQEQIYPLLPLRDIVIFPHMIVPRVVGREKSVKALDMAMSADRKIILLTQKDPAVDNPKADEMFTVGTMGSVVQLLRLPDGTVNNQVQWYDFYMPGVVKKIINTEQIKELSGGTPIHLLSAVLSLYDACTVNNPSDMEKVLVDDSMLPQE